ncbi:DUF1127 domain-containing protein [Rhodobacter sp. SGA-6-6]|uniref:DUF1127 domain-containing protein n=1 Tax=Rhodobacter sp. SGA-6-6 TaxID=2710882 RepID=UPI0013ED2136|nr:DUF1127 domain-containing protein [Rhodobacter sp. SGA-6-6]NGM45295.1 DUF1127 domain-containing protein [Rhodobacter sp. SGA-6-6]
MTSPARTLPFRPLPLRRRGLLARLLGMASLRRQRARLAALDDRMLRDIGLNRPEAEAEAARPAWDAPQHWRK